MKIRRALVVGFAAIGLGVPAPALANVHTGQTTVVFSEQGAYACDGDCATASTFSAWGTLDSPGSGLGRVRFSVAGTVLGLNEGNTCLVQSEVWTFTARGGKDALTANTTTDSFCFGIADPNVNNESGHFEGVGTAGNWAGLHFSGDFAETVLGSPQIASGTITVRVG